MSLRKKSLSLDFYQSIALTELPIITFLNNGKRYNMLVDTGSNWSYINSQELESMITTKESVSKSFVSANGGNTNCGAKHTIDFAIKGFILTHDFIENDFSMTFGNIKQETGVNLSGIIGTDFLRKYKFVVNFEEYKITLKCNDKPNKQEQQP